MAKLLIKIKKFVGGKKLKKERVPQTKKPKNRKKLNKRAIRTCRETGETEKK